MLIKKLFKILLTTLILLLIPLIAMRYTNEVNWTQGDFMVAGVLLIGTGLVYQFVIKTIIKARYRMAMSVVLLIVLLLIWAELAVGIFGTPIAGN